jgi:hypothetical protein
MSPTLGILPVYPRFDVPRESPESKVAFVFPWRKTTDAKD